MKGKLEKQVRELYDEYLKPSIKSDFDGEMILDVITDASQQVAHIISKVLEIIAECRKEFPSHLMDLLLNSNYKEIEEWFEEWLCGGDKE